MLSAFVYLATFFDSAFGADATLVQGLPGQLARTAAWCSYVFCAGSVGTGVWVIAHECTDIRLDATGVRSSNLHAC